jgi:hypothetical protein
MRALLPAQAASDICAAPRSAPKTRHDDVQRVKNFAAFLGRSPDTATFEDVRRYQMHLAAQG